MNSSAVIRRSFSAVCAFSCALLVAVSAARAEVPQAGRLQNGKPYRIDAQGIKITDQLAELEVENNDLRRQLIALEDQVKGKPQVAAVAPSCPRVDCPAASAPAPKCPVVTCPTATCPEVSCPTVSCPATDCTASIRPFQDAAQEAKRRTSEIEAEVLSLRQTSNDSLAGKNTELASLSGDLSQAKKRMAELEAELAAQVAARTAAQTAAQAAAQIATQATTAQAMTTQARANLREPVLRSDEREDEVAQVENAKSETKSAVDIQGTIRTQLTRVQSLIIERKNLLDRVKAAKKGVSIQIQSLVSSQGRSLDSLRVVVSQTHDADELMAASSELGEIVGKLQTDISVLGRITKLP